MGLPLTIQVDDNRRIEALKKRLKVKTKIDIIRAGLHLLEEDVERQERIKQWKKAVAATQNESRKVNDEFSTYSLLRQF